MDDPYDVVPTVINVEDKVVIILTDTRTSNGTFIVYTAEKAALFRNKVQEAIEKAEKYSTLQRD